MKLHYVLNGAFDLEYTLAMAQEIKAEIGLVPDSIELDSGEQVTFDKQDFRRLEKGEINTEDYISKHRKIQ